MSSYANPSPTDRSARSPTPEGVAAAPGCVEPGAGPTCTVAAATASESRGDHPAQQPDSDHRTQIHQHSHFQMGMVRQTRNDERILASR